MDFNWGLINNISIQGKKTHKIDPKKSYSDTHNRNLKFV